MSRPKVWTRRAATERASRREEQEQQARHERGRRRVIIGASWSTAVVAAFTAFGALTATVPGPVPVVIAALCGLLVVGGVWAHRSLAQHLGRLTAVLALAVVGGGLFLAVAGLSPQCPDSSAVGRCSTGELANWSLVGMLMPLTGAFVVGVPLLVSRTVARLARFAFRLWSPPPGVRGFTAAQRVVRRLRRR